MRRIIHDKDFMQFVMKPPAHEEAMTFSGDIPNVSSMRILDRGLGQVPNADGGWGISIGTVAISALVVSALAFMALCVVAMMRRR